MKKKTKNNAVKAALATVKGAFGAIPVVGSLISEYIGLTNDIIVSKRQDEWMFMVEEKLEKLECNMSEIADNEFFYSCVQIATVGALKAYESEKRKLFADALYNSYTITDISNEKKLTFLHLIDRYNLITIIQLQLFSETEADFKSEVSKNPEYAYSQEQIKQYTPIPEDDVGFTRAIISQLASDGLCEEVSEKMEDLTPNMRLVIPRYYSKRIRTTPFGEEFLRFITTKEETEE